LGRDRENDLVIAARTVSRSHARLFEDAGRWFVEDRGSANGTFLNGQRIPPHTPMRVRHANRVDVGPQAFVVSNPAEAEDPEQTDAGLELPDVPERDLTALQRQVVRILCTEWINQGTLDRLPSQGDCGAHGHARRGADRQGRPPPRLCEGRRRGAGAAGEAARSVPDRSRPRLDLTPVSVWDTAVTPCRVPR